MKFSVWFVCSSLISIVGSQCYVNENETTFFYNETTLMGNMCLLENYDSSEPPTEHKLLPSPNLSLVVSLIPNNNSVCLSMQKSNETIYLGCLTEDLEIIVPPNHGLSLLIPQTVTRSEFKFRRTNTSECDKSISILPESGTTFKLVPGCILYLRYIGALTFYDISNPYVGVKVYEHGSDVEIAKMISPTNHYVSHLAPPNLQNVRALSTDATIFTLKQTSMDINGWPWNGNEISVWRDPGNCDVPVQNATLSNNQEVTFNYTHYESYCGPHSVRIFVNSSEHDVNRHNNAYLVFVNHTDTMDWDGPFLQVYEYDPERNHTERRWLLKKADSYPAVIFIDVLDMSFLGSFGLEGFSTVVRHMIVPPECTCEYIDGVSIKSSVSIRVKIPSSCHIYNCEFDLMNYYKETPAVQAKEYYYYTIIATVSYDFLYDNEWLGLSEEYRAILKPSQKRLIRKPNSTDVQTIRLKTHDSLRFVNVYYKRYVSPNEMMNDQNMSFFNINFTVSKTICEKLWFNVTEDYQTLTFTKDSRECKYRIHYLVDPATNGSIPHSYQRKDDWTIECLLNESADRALFRFSANVTQSDKKLFMNVSSILQVKLLDPFDFDFTKSTHIVLKFRLASPSVSTSSDPSVPPSLDPSVPSSSDPFLPSSFGPLVPTVPPSSDFLTTEHAALLCLILLVVTAAGGYVCFKRRERHSGQSYERLRQPVTFNRGEETVNIGSTNSSSPVPL